VAIRDALCAHAVANDLVEAEVPSQVYDAAWHMSPEGIALAGAWGDLQWELGEAGSAAREWLAGLCNVRLLITGEDLLAAGIPEGPEIGRRLEAALLAKLDGELAGDGREAELDAALRGERR
jgi:tRNA nucleotidyltransferase (CCA-adding enzyme)